MLKMSTVFEGNQQYLILKNGVENYLRKQPESPFMYVKRV
jgi:hypothetical protein